MSFREFEDLISKEKKIILELKGGLSKEQEEKKIKELKDLNDKIPLIIKDIKLNAPVKKLPETKNYSEKGSGIKKKIILEKPKRKIFTEEELELERGVLNRIKRGREDKKKQKTIKPNPYVKISNKFFAETSVKLYKKRTFETLREDLIQANLQFLPVSYISVIFFTTLLSMIAALFLFVFLLFFNFGIEIPFITRYNGDLFPRLIKTFWVLFVIPISTFFVMYIYPSLEKGSIKDKINQELPFVTIHMASIAGSMIEPSKIFEIVTLTGEYPNTSKEFKKIINEINIYGYNLVGALRETASNTSSEKLRDLLNGVSTTITSGGNLEQFFEKRADSLLFEYRLEREKYTRMAETFMDIYISVVIAAPMILMLLLMMIKVTGLGISLSSSMITFIIIFIISIINVIFLVVLKIKQPQA